ncbi:MAG TPA: tetratricopeptide repeat protein [Gemmatimonadaceae bacterium]|nr:tetratricopeptide repeat protein [Gemmatimonadaceae bacterium]
MKSSRVLGRFGIALAVVAIGGLALTRGSVLPSATAAAPREPGFTERGQRDIQLKVWHQALDADPTSALVMGQLAALHLQRAREGGSHDDYVKAESYARRSLTKRTNRNAGTAATLVSVLLAQHRFTEARDVAEDLVAREPETPEYRAALGEVTMELGDYATAERMFRSVWTDRGTLTIAARLARWLEISNHVPQARRLLAAARADAMSRRDVASETKAWFALRVGDLELREGRYDAAEDAFNEGLLIEPDDPRLLAAMARLAAAKRDYDDVITWGERSIGMQLDPATLGLVGDAYAARGNRAKAHEYFTTLSVAVSMQPGAYHRAWSLYLLDHGLQVPDVLAKAQEELLDRKDVYGYDILAWALEKSGRHVEAQAAMREALRMNTPDPLLRQHARVIGVTAPSSTGA